MRTRALATLWLGIGLAVWCGFFDLYVSRGARLYGQLHAEYELRLTHDEPSMAAVMADAKRAGLIAASSWASLVVAAGWATIWWAGGARSRQASREPS